MKKLTAIILSISLILCLFSVCGYAGAEKPFYLVLGDSIAYGSGIFNSKDAVILMQTLYNPQSGYLRAPYQQGADRINAAIKRYNTAQRATR